MSVFMRLKPFQGPKEYKFVDPDTGYRFRGRTRQELLSHIVAYRAQNQLEPIEELGLVVENYLCTLPENCGSCHENQAISRGFLKTIKGGVVLLVNVALKKFVTPEKADERGAVCLNCPHNVFPDKDRFVRWSDDLALHSIGERRSKHHEALGTCDLCDCPLRVKVWNGVKVKPDRPALYPHFCWQIKEDSNGK